MKSFYRISLAFLCLFAATQASAQTVLTFYTSKGTFKTTLTDTKTPRTVDSMIARVSHKFYDGLIFHRVISGFMIQGGDPLGTGMGGPGYTTPDEFDTSLKNVPGAIAMANSGPNTNGSQFYINVANNTWLNGGYTVFGMTTTNYSVVQTISTVATNSSDKPLVDVKMDSVRITHLHTTAVTTTGGGIQASIYPNPGSGVFTIALPEVSTTVRIIDITGREVFHTQGQGMLTADITKQGTGLYFAHLENRNGTAVYRVVVQ